MPTSTYDRGAACVLCGKAARDMSQEELLEFIGQLDMLVEALHERMRASGVSIDNVLQDVIWR